MTFIRERRHDAWFSNIPPLVLLAVLIDHPVFALTEFQPKQPKTRRRTYIEPRLNEAALYEHLGSDFPTLTAPPV